MNRNAILGPAAMIVVALAFAVFRGGAQEASPAPGTPADAIIPGLVAYDVPFGHSTDPVVYPQNPPAGGVHHAVPQTCGFYDQPVGNEHAVHSLEHGAVWITYQPDLPPDPIEQLRVLAATSDHILVSPYPGLPAPVVASAWGYQLLLDRADDPRLLQFVERFVNQGPEPGAACLGTDEVVPMASPVAGSPVAATPVT